MRRFLLILMLFSSIAWAQSYDVTCTGSPTCTTPSNVVVPGDTTFPLTVSGTVTSGGIPYFNSTTQESSSALLPSGDFVLGGGAGGAPTATFSVVPAANGGTGSATAAAHTIFGNTTGSSAAPAFSTAPSATSLTLLDTAANTDFTLGLSNYTLAVTSSPKALIAGSYQSAASTFAEDSWTLGVVIGTGTNGTSYLTLAHSGTTGQAALVTATGNGLVVGSASTPIINAGNSDLYVNRGSSVGKIFIGNGAASTHYTMLEDDANGNYIAATDSANLFEAFNSGGMQINSAGLESGAPTGGLEGTGTVNATAYYVNGALQTIPNPTGTPTYTAGTNVTSVACASGYTCTNQRGELTIVGGTATTGTIATVNFSATLSTAPGLCMVTQEGGASVFGIGHGTPSTTSFTITSSVSVAASTVTVDYLCLP